jgi:high-affinity K+ transport system ATPase subunit B
VLRRDGLGGILVPFPGVETLDMIVVACGLA